MKYKIIKHNCNCKYIFIKDPEKRILKEFKFCPKHSKLRKYVMLWCIDCGLKIIETGKLSWQRKKRCLSCAKADQKKRTLQNWQQKAKKYNAKRRGKTKKIDFFPMEKTGALKLLYRKMSTGLPVVETPILNNYMTKKRRNI